MLNYVGDLSPKVV